MNTTAAFAVPDVSAVAEARRAGQLTAERLGFTPERAGRVALVVTELATNLARHAHGGQILLRALGQTTAPDEPPGVEILALDRGPGIADEGWSRTDGHSTAGTLGHGLGAIHRQSDFFQIYSQPRGTAAVARLWRDGLPDGRSLPLHEVGGVVVSKPGEPVCGDDMGWRHRPERLSLLVADGLGHGVQAHEASRAAVRAFLSAPDAEPQRIVTDTHAAIRATRGAAVACLAFDIPRGVARFCGLGNISAVILHPTGTRQSLISQNGTAGHTAPRILEFSYPIPRGSVLVLHSDGLSTHWDLAAYPGLRSRHPSVIAGVLYRDHCRGRDDVTVAVVKERGA